MVELNKNQSNIICVADLKDGQIAEIVEWGSTFTYIGLIVQRYADTLIVIGGTMGASWTNFTTLDDSHKVRILEDGEILTIKNNQ